MTIDELALETIAQAQSFFQKPPLNWKRIKRKLQVSYGNISLDIEAHSINRTQYSCSIMIKSELCAQFLSVLKGTSATLDLPKMNTILGSNFRVCTLGVIEFFIVKDKKIKSMGRDSWEVYRQNFLIEGRLVPLGYSSVSESRFSEFCSMLIFALEKNASLYHLMSPKGLIGQNLYSSDYFYKGIFAARLSGVSKEQVVKDFKELDGQIYWRGFDSSFLEPAVLYVWELTDDIIEVTQDKAKCHSGPRSG